jgi:hypothetical protein
MAGFAGVNYAKDWGTEWWDDYQLKSAHASQLEDTVNRSNLQLKIKNEQIALMEVDAAARKAEVAWARDREHKREKLVKELRRENNELQKILDSRVPVDLVK